MSTPEKRAEILATQERRYATKSFDPTKKIPTEDFEIIMEAARLSPSSFGYEPWKFLIVENEQMKADLKSVAWGAVNSLNGASHFIIALARKNVTFDSFHVKHMVEDVMKTPYAVDSKQSLFFKKFQEEDFNLTTTEALFQWAVKQSYLAMANMMTTAAYLDIDSCPIEGFNKEKVEQYLADKGLVDLQEFGVAYMLGLGYRNENIRPKRRQKLTEIFETIA
jgi:nitroreductase